MTTPLPAARKWLELVLARRASLDHFFFFLHLLFVLDIVQAYYTEIKQRYPLYKRLWMGKGFK